MPDDKCPKCGTSTYKTQRIPCETLAVCPNILCRWSAQTCEPRRQLAAMTERVKTLSMKKAGLEMENERLQKARECSDEDNALALKELARQLIDMTERAEKAEAERDAVLQEARVWAGEAKAQRHTVNEVGSALGGVPDWGPIAKGVRGKLEALRKAQAEVERLREEVEDLSAELEQADEQESEADHA